MCSIEWLMAAAADATIMNGRGAALCPADGAAGGGGGGGSLTVSLPSTRRAKAPASQPATQIMTHPLIQFNL